MIYQSCSEHLSKHISSVLHSNVAFTISLALFLPLTLGLSNLEMRNGEKVVLRFFKLPIFWMHCASPLALDKTKSSTAGCVSGAQFQAGAVLMVEVVEGILHLRKVLFLLFNLPFFVPSVCLQNPEEATVTLP